MDQPTEETLDPQDWQAMRVLGHRMVDDMLTYLQTVRERPVWQPVPDQVKEDLRKPLPIDPQSPEDAYHDFVENVLPYPLGNIHPRFWGWVMGNGTPFGALAEMLAATMNPNLGGGNHVANHVELQVLDWCKQMLGMPLSASGLLVSGGSMANLVGLTVARNSRAGFDIRRQGLPAAPKRLVLYGSVEMHSSIEKAVELLGLGREALRMIPTNERFQIDLAALEKTIAADRTAGAQPFCLIGNAGTVNTGAIDPLNDLADLARREKLWFHIDGAFGALGAVSPELRPLLTGLERADSIAFDLHKWMYMPFEVGCVLVRDPEAHRLAFTLTPEYLAHFERGAASGSHWFNEYGPQLTRGFRALKVWLSIKEHGIAKYGRIIKQNVDQCRYLTRLIEASPDLELLAPTSLNIVCFRFKTAGGAEAALNHLNEQILMELHVQGIAVPTYTTLNGKFAIRVANTNHRSRREDFEVLVREVIRLGKALSASAQA
ncbi:MAG TPA: aminotransferase class V-fold PLP-dependent enzyme [Anaerolineales bacterium]|nr:aminotransferase class V-fold PLP-dependent enzyme [Anaerolineales bacterium]